MLLLDAGIDVLTTMNLQHLERLNDQILQITGVRVRETVPDWVIKQAEEVVMVDVTPEALINRLRRDVVYEPAKAQRALENFFREQSLAALRELALRQAAHEVEVRHEPAPSTDRILIHLTNEPSTAMLIRRGRRVADYLRAECFAVYVSETGDLTKMLPTDREAVERHLNFARNLHIETRILEGPEPAAALVDLPPRTHHADLSDAAKFKTAGPFLGKSDFGYVAPGARYPGHDRRGPDIRKAKALTGGACGQPTIRTIMTAALLLVIADPNASFLAPLAERVPPGLRIEVSQTPEELRTRAPEADAILFAHVDPELLIAVLPHAVRLRWIHSLWTGVDGILKPPLIEHPALLTNGRGVFRGPLADWVTGVMLFFAFDFRRVIHQQQERVWKPFIGRTLQGLTLGIVGYGEIGSAAAERARVFGMKIAALRRRPELFSADSRIDQAYGPAQLNDLLSASDYVLVVTPLTPETRGLIAEEQLDAMKPTAVLINIGRGPVVNEGALIRALQSGTIRGAALDVFDTEPLPQDHPFWSLPNVLLSPHTADRVEGFLAPAFDCFFDNLGRFLAGEALSSVVDKQAGY